LIAEPRDNNVVATRSHS